MVSKHTPGPWIHRNGRIFQADYDVLTIANVARAHNGDYSPSNGDLLAAAPDLLEALVQMLAKVRRADPDGLFDDLVVIRARAAIAKAKGETE